jgi:hypothetical protein
VKGDTQQMTKTEALVALVLLALELRVDVTTLRRRFAGSIVLNEAGLESITCERARMYMAAVRAEAAEIHSAALRLAAEQAEQGNPARLRVQAIKAAQQGGDGVDAYAAMVGNDPDNPLNRAGRNMDEMLTGQATYHRLQED